MAYVSYYALEVVFFLFFFSKPNKRINLAWSNFDVNYCKLSSLYCIYTYIQCMRFKSELLSCTIFLLEHSRESSKQETVESRQLACRLTLLWNRFNELKWLFRLQSANRRQLEEEQPYLVMLCKQMGMNCAHKMWKNPTNASAVAPAAAAPSIT